MKILLDEGLPRRSAALLRDEGIDALHLTEVADLVGIRKLPLTDSPAEPDDPEQDA